MSDGVDSPRPTPPSIFNDVIGPVMRGPSSSHCAAAVRIGRMARDLVAGEPRAVLVELHPDGSLATTHATQGSDMGLFGGLLGWEANDERLPDSPRAIQEAGIEVEIRLSSFPAFHPNTYRITLTGPGRRHRMTALSVGGGMIRVVEVDEVQLRMEGDYHETLIFLPDGPRDPPEEHGEAPVARTWEAVDAAGDPRPDEVVLGSGPGLRIVQIKTVRALSAEALRELEERFPGREILALRPALPIGSRREMNVPFRTALELLARGRRLAGGSGELPPLWEAAVQYECARGDMEEGQVLERAEALVAVLEDSIGRGLAGTQYADRILPAQAQRFSRRMEDGGLLDGGVLNRIVLYVTAMMEVKSSMGVIVAAPTAGACGVLPGALLAAAHELGLSARQKAQGLLAAGAIGLLIAARSTFAAEVCGCQAECGAASGMAAAALVTLKGGPMDQALAAASMALQNSLGMICDPVANRVEVPCLGKNVMAAANALTCANMAIAGFDPVIPLDEVIETMDRVGRSLPRELRCTALGGLSVTPAAKAIEVRLSGEA